MGYTHGTRWTDERIREGILEVVEAYGLDRMPSASEVKRYDDNLANAITKRKGWYRLAREMGLPIKESETYFGKCQEEVARQQLVVRGHEVQRMPQNFPYDLLVDDCVKVDVKASRLYCGAEGNFYSYNLEKPYCTCDIYLLYMLNDDRTTRDVLVVPSVHVARHTKISVGETHSKYHKYRDKWGYIDEYSRFMGAVGCDGKNAL